MSTKTQTYSYDLLPSEISNESFIITLSNGETITFFDSEITQMKANKKKGYYIIEIKFSTNLDTNVRAARLHKNWSGTKKIDLSWNQNGDSHRRGDLFNGNITSYKEYFLPTGNYLEIVILNETVSSYNKFVSCGNFYALIELDKESIDSIKKTKNKNFDKSDLAWNGIGSILGIGAIVACASEELSVMAVGAAAITFIYGVNTVSTCTCNIYFSLTGQNDRIDSVNFIKNNLFEAFTAYVLQATPQTVKKTGQVLSDIVYYGTEIFFGGLGAEKTLKKVAKNWNKLGRFFKLDPKKVKVYGGAVQDAAFKKPKYMRFGYALFDIANNGNSVINNEVSVLKSIYETPTTNGSAINVSGASWK